MDWEPDYVNPAEEEAQQRAAEGVTRYVARVMGWMCVGLFTTLAVALACIAIPQVTDALYNSYTIYAVILLQFGVVLGLSAALRKMSPGVATGLFLVYAALTGVTFSALFMLFGTFSLIYAFGVTAFVFVTMSLYGMITKKDLTRMGALAMFGLLGVIVAGVVNMFIGNGLMDFLITCAGIVIFIGLVAYDTQKIKAFYLEAVSVGEDDYSPVMQKMAIYGAFTLYLDFINLFLKLLRLMGRRRN